MVFIHSFRSLARSQTSLPSWSRQLQMSKHCFNPQVDARPISFLTCHRPRLPQQSTSCRTTQELSDTLRTRLPEFGPDVAISSHPAFVSIQVRYAARNTMNGWTHWKRKRRHGLMNRMKTKSGRAILKRRKEKGRWTGHKRMMNGNPTILHDPFEY
ncbi:hypothetical protein EJ05DRAFT_480956 [Pseudovirgaria hyperparasitica]|uniref:Ribosomal protein L34 n=1 Tax=Pseudovirgaria hyperparasitica TaxID=470096 RepID=A0A6A6VRM0_9PEZI|nr:uncharacterized protein EJ05DRAFT_480956 [Pseudovirgaria hyperparasitica]KAF2752805.1 hypothetical protein EJ05DRAFT_480956 [Pseudovirgaria hyperparasitica]